MAVRVSIILACHNDAGRLPPSLESVRAQTINDWELVTVDDGSSDATAALLESAAGRDPRIRLARNDRRMGLTRSLNRGIAVAAGRYLARLDAGDRFLPEKLERQLAFMEQHPRVVLCGTQVVFVSGDREVGRSRFACDDASIRRRFLTRQGITCHPSIVFRNEGITYNEEFEYSQDLDLYMRLASRGELAALDEYLTVCEQEFRGITVSRKYEQRQYQNAAYRLYRRGAYAAGREAPSIKGMIRSLAWERRWCERSMKFYHRYMITRIAGRSCFTWLGWLGLACLVYPPLALDYLNKLAGWLMLRRG